MSRTVLVTGASGYIGTHVVKSLLELGVSVQAIDRNTGDIDPRVRRVELDIFEDNKNIYEDLEKPDIVLHLAWRDGFVHNSDSHMKYLYSHFNFLKNLIDGGLKHLVVMGTMHEVGYYEGEIDENTPTNPYSLYGVSKNSLRQALEVYLRDKNVVFQWLRAFYIYGDDSRNKSIFAKIMQAEQEGKERFPFTSGEKKYDFILVEELALQIALASLQTEVTGIINCCSGQPVSLREKVEEFIKNNGFNIKLEYGAYPDRPYDSPAIWGNNKKIQYIIENYESNRIAN
ncbi:MAG: NAD(P)-dependent oxidoreductase [Paenibacillus macerans]|uniref:NAD-dependent epimerase/dehydratase family protein n=1 Tax=Paenibacillus macerans TaxID=44252 RepID=UPI001B2E5F2C|nr:NAD(P)-dependent oxidoreductase [Paenibacillus macerans]MDU7473079.1 NAD(P)-dependent oxidoreductase [Paenibacillus macerans]GIP08706.1 nucleoside-diphosphate sugar epimerase [Paenibacillus macerans]